MRLGSDTVFHELQRLSKREGLRRRFVGKSVGPQLRFVCDVNDLDPHETVRDKVTTKLGDLIGQYDDQEILIARTALGMHPPTEHAALGRRVNWLALQLRWSPSTVQRRKTEVLRKLAYDAVVDGRISAAAAAAGYVVEAFDATVRFNGKRATITERRKIRAVRRLVELRCRHGIPRTPHGAARDLDIGIAVLHGGRFLRYERQRGREGDALAYLIEPVHPIDAGEVYEFEIEHSYPAEEPMPHYVVQATTPFDSFSLTVCFDPRELPGSVWKVSGAGHREVDVQPAAEEMLSLDPSGRMGEFTFYDIRAGGSYGAAWTWR